jgi:DNA-binding HxlR family transcriptional regulator
MPARPRRYNDPCGIARALDAIGDRWALLVVRELLLGPKRFSQLRRGLHDASANVLSQRLRDLEAAGLVRHYKLAPPASVLVYELTERGSALEPVLIELGRWGSQLPPPVGVELGVDALMIALKTRFNARVAADLCASYELRLGEDHFRLDVADGRLQLARGRLANPAAVIDTDPATLRAVAFGRQSLADALRSERLGIQGNQDAAARLLNLFAAP